MHILQCRSSIFEARSIKYRTNILERFATKGHLYLPSANRPCYRRASIETLFSQATLLETRIQFWGT